MLPAAKDSAQGLVLPLGLCWEPQFRLLDGNTMTGTLPLFLQLFCTKILYYFLPSKKSLGPGLVSLSGLGVIPKTERPWVQFLVRAHAWVACQAPSWRRERGNQSVSLAHLFFSLSFFLPSPLSKKVKIKKLNLKNKSLGRLYRTKQNCTLVVFPFPNRNQTILCLKHCLCLRQASKPINKPYLKSVRSVVMTTLTNPSRKYLCSRLCSKHFTGINSFNPHNGSVS